MGKPGCHLCDDADVIIDAIASEFPSVQVVRHNILDDARLFDEWHNDIPVVLIDGVQHSTRHGHAVMAFKHFRDIRQNGRDRIATLNAALRKRMGKLHATITQAGVIALHRAMHHGRIIRINLRGAFKKQ
jgi:hypothetical protein